MMFRRFALLWLACLTAAGCHARNGNRELLERELRLQEDRIYDLEDELAAANRRLEACQRELQDRGGAGAATEGFGQPPQVTVPSLDAAPPTTFEPGTPEEDAPRFEAPPYEEAPYYDEPAFEANPQQLDAPRYEPGPHQEDSAPYDEEASPADEQTYVDPAQDVDYDEFGFASLPVVGSYEDEEFEETDFRISEITLNRLLTQSYDDDDEAGSDGILVVVEPRNAAGRIINVPAQISVVVADPTLAGPSSRIARWDFDAEDAADRFRQTTLGRGMHFRLPWKDEIPSGRDVMVHVRCITTDGVELRAERELKIPSPGESSRGWMASTRPLNPPRETDERSVPSAGFGAFDNGSPAAAVEPAALPSPEERDTEATDEPVRKPRRIPTRPIEPANLPSVSQPPRQRERIAAQPPASELIPEAEATEPREASQPAPIKRRRVEWSPYR